LFSVSDADGDAITTYGLWDTQGNGHWVVNGVTQATNSEIDISAAQLSQTSYVFGSGTDTLYIRANDGSLWSNWTAFTANPFADHAPVVTVANVAIGAGQSRAASSLFNVSDPDGDSITTYAFWDTQGNGHWSINGVTQATNAEIDVPAANLSQVSYQSGLGTGTDTLYVRANDGTLWSAWQAFTAGPVAPTVTAANINTVAGQTLAAAPMFTPTDPNGSAFTTYAFWDTQGNGHWSINGATQATNAEIDVAATSLSQVSYTAGVGADTLYVRAFDGSLWSAWQSFTATGESSAIVNAGATLELATAYSSQVTFSGSTGTLKLDDPSSFTGTVAGMTGSDAIDFTNLNFNTTQAPTFSGTSSGGTLHVTDGTHTTNIALLGNYMASTFVASSDGHGGTLVVDPPASGQNNLLAASQHTA
jgi:aspartate 1-decarboxylase